MHVHHRLTKFLPCAANPNSILLRFGCYRFQEVSVVLGKTKVVVGTHVDGIVYCPPS